MDPKSIFTRIIFNYGKHNICCSNHCQLHSSGAAAFTGLHSHHHCVFTISHHSQVTLSVRYPITSHLYLLQHLVISNLLSMNFPLMFFRSIIVPCLSFYVWLISCDINSKFIQVAIDIKMSSLFKLRNSLYMDKPQCVFPSSVDLSQTFPTNLDFIRVSSLTSWLL